MHIDCDRCEMRGLACSDCVVSVLLGPIDSELGGEEREALGVLAEAGLVPPLRLVVTEGDAASRNSAETTSRDLREAREAG
ncbi:hypothetical protein [Jiangella anatolica]|nr:hypothetical protein [Jiangella anatolica]